jgi:hypothetical protein
LAGRRCAANGLTADAVLARQCAQRLAGSMPLRDHGAKIGRQHTSALNNQTPRATIRHRGVNTEQAVEVREFS